MLISFRMPLLGSLLAVAVLGVEGCSRENTLSAVPANGEQSTQISMSGNSHPGVIAIAVTSDGFAPNDIKVPGGRPVTLSITRTVDKTCATEIVIKDYQIRKALPLNKPVEISFTPKGAGSIRFACGMDMVSGVINVE